MVRFVFSIVLMVTSLSLVGCKDKSDDFDMKLTNLSRTSVGVKNIDSRKLKDCVILLNGVNGFWHEPERANFKKGESRSFSLARFFTSAKRQFNYKVDAVSSVTVNCNKPRGSAVVFETNSSFTGFLK